MKPKSKLDKEAGQKILDLYIELHNAQNILKNAEKEMNKDASSMKKTTSKLRDILINEKNSKIIDK